MKHKILESKDKTKVVRIEDKSIVISDEQSFLDLFMNVINGMIYFLLKVKLKL